MHRLAATPAALASLLLGLLGLLPISDARAERDPLSEAEARLWDGRYDDVEAWVRRVPDAGRPEAEGLLGEALRRRGRYADGQRVLKAALDKHGRKALRVRYELGLLYELTGQLAEAKAIWNGFYDDYESGALDKTKARDLRYVALAAQHLRSWRDANDLFRESLAADEKGREGALTNLAWAALFLEKYDAAHAEVCLKEALEVLPKQADLHALYAAVKLEQGYDVEGAEQEISLALAANPKQTDALALRAELAVDADEFGEAERRLAPILQINPVHPRARTLAAAVRLLADDEAGFAKVRTAVLAQNPKDADFFFHLGEILAKQHRYPDASRFAEEAILLEPKHYGALALLGANRLRLGEEQSGLEALRKAWSKDPFNVRTFNLLNLFEKVIPKSYEVVTSPHFRLRVATTEKIFADHALPLLEAAWEDMTRRYKITPQAPVSVEVFADPQHYAVRTIGLPGLAALGVTFGPVVTARSPSSAHFHWGMVLWHELGHVFSLALTKNRVPRWFTEGLSEYETTRRDPTWTRHTYAELYRARLDGALLPTERLNHAFLRSKSIEQMVVAYHQSKEVVTFIAERWGFDKILDLLQRFRDGQDTKRAIEGALGLKMAEFDRQFVASLADKLKPYEGTMVITSSEISNLAEIKEAVEQKRATPRQVGIFALALVKTKKADEAKRLLAELALTCKPDKFPPEARFAEAEAAYEAKDLTRAEQLFTALATSGGDGYEVQMRLAQIALAQKQLAKVQAHLDRAKAVEPHQARPYLEEQKLALKATPPATEAALRATEAAARLDIMDAEHPRFLVKEYVAQKRYTDALAAAERGLLIDPFSVSLYAGRARALLGLGRKREALQAIDQALRCSPKEAEQRELKQLAGEAGRVAL